MGAFKKANPPEEGAFNAFETPDEIEPVVGESIYMHNPHAAHVNTPESDLSGDMGNQEKQLYEPGEARYKRLGWKRLTIVMIVEAIALGTLSIPSTFATLGMVAGVICSVGIGCIAIYTSWIVGLVKLKFPHITTYPDAGGQMWGKFGFYLMDIMLCLQLTFLLGSHCLTGTIAFTTITKSSLCTIVWNVVSAIILFVLAIPPSFAEVAILGYIDFASILAAVGITIIATGITSHKAPGGLDAVNWGAWPKDDLKFSEAFNSISNILFAYSFAMCQFAFMDEMHTPEDFTKSIYLLGFIEIFIYTVTGALIFRFVGRDVQAPALLSAGDTISRVAFGVALPVIFISGSINTTVLGRMIHGRIYRNSPIRFINSPMGWTTWIMVIGTITVIAFIIAEVIPFFSDLLSICSALFVSGFTFYFPPFFWFYLLREGPWNRKNITLGALNVFCVAIGLLTLGAGTYSAIDDIIDQYRNGTVSGVFSCSKTS
ncbi:amino acid transporter [Ascosphaera apis ARSEF 7405]|uniref:Amino acid transporter n=1 Tax=Ascosphaera apis ARSEF 7405 TaxID=392613 RepID=A0A167WH79_9EURO|nr:amino acid transporter [Ascosphaera apis ARSEF 7405]